MGILILCIAAIIVGIIMNEKSYGDWVFLTIVGAIVLVICLAISVSAHYRGQVNIKLYEQDKLRIERAITQEISMIEMKEVMNLAMADNKIIITNRVMRHNFWVGLFYYDPIGDLELFDITKIKESNTKIKINN